MLMQSQFQEYCLLYNKCSIIFIERIIKIISKLYWPRKGLFSWKENNIFSSGVRKDKRKHYKTAVLL